MGAGVDLALPGFAVATLNAYYRDDSFNRPTYQLTTVWSVPFRVLGLRAAFDGFVDVSGTDRDGTDILTQPQLLLAPAASSLRR